MRVASWNVKRLNAAKVPRVAEAVIGLDADVVFLSEWEPQAGKLLGEVLAAAGWAHQTAVHSALTPAAVTKKWGVFAASRYPIEPIVIEHPPVSPAGWLELRVPAVDLILVGARVIVPTPAGLWDWFRQQVDRLASHRAMLLGDLNASASSRALQALLNFGWIDAIAATCQPPPPSYWGDNGATGRNDYALVAPSLAHSIVSASHVTEAASQVLAGPAGAISDHAAVILHIAEH